MLSKLDAWARRVPRRQTTEWLRARGTDRLVKEPRCLVSSGRLMIFSKLDAGLGVSSGGRQAGGCGLGELIDRESCEAAGMFRMQRQTDVKVS